MKCRCAFYFSFFFFSFSYSNHFVYTNIIMTNLYKNALDHLKQFYDSLPKTQIKFIVLHASNLNDVKIKTEFSEYVTKKLQYYVTHGLQRNGLYIYKVSHIRYLLKSFRMTATTPAILYDVIFEDKIINNNKKTRPEYDVNRADHMTFNVIQNRASQVIVKTHQTNYIDNHAFVFQQRIVGNECNFTYNPANINKFIDFKTIPCENGQTPSTISKYPLVDLKMLHKLCVVMDPHQPLPLSIPGGSRMKQVGGARASYKTIEFMSEQFFQFLITSLLRPFTDQIPCGNIQIIFDEANVHSNDHILIIIDDIEENRYIVCIRTISALKSCYSSNHEEKEPSKQETTCLNRYNEHIHDILEKIKVEPP